MNSFLILVGLALLILSLLMPVFVFLIANDVGKIRRMLQQKK